jgi:hypothetical protein
LYENSPSPTANCRISNFECRRDEEWIRFLFFLDRIYRIDEIFFACGERPFGRRPLYPDDPVNPVQLLFIDKKPFLFFAVLPTFAF